MNSAQIIVSATQKDRSVTRSARTTLSAVVFIGDYSEAEIIKRPAAIVLNAIGELGKSLQRLAAERTQSLKPPHQYVPWVVVNGIPLLEDVDNVMKYICVAYTGRDRCEKESETCFMYGV